MLKRIGLMGCMLLGACATDAQDGRLDGATYNEWVRGYNGAATHKAAVFVEYTVQGVPHSRGVAYSNASSFQVAETLAVQACVNTPNADPGSIRCTLMARDNQSVTDIRHRLAPERSNSASDPVGEVASFLGDLASVTLQVGVIVAAGALGARVNAPRTSSPTYRPVRPPSDPSNSAAVRAYSDQVAANMRASQNQNQAALRQAEQNRFEAEQRSRDSEYRAQQEERARQAREREAEEQRRIEMRRARIDSFCVQWERDNSVIHNFCSRPMNVMWCTTPNFMEQCTPNSMAGSIPPGGRAMVSPVPRGHYAMGYACDSSSPQYYYDCRLPGTPQVEWFNSAIMRR